MALDERSARKRDKSAKPRKETSQVSPFVLARAGRKKLERYGGKSPFGIKAEKQ